MIPKTFYICTVTLLFFTSMLNEGMATMGGMTNVGPIFTQGESSTAIRELVELKPSGELLVARPRHAFVEMITVQAPGLREGHLILRELLTRDGKQTLLLTAPEEIVTQVERVTLYTKGLERSLVMLENINGVWEKHLPQSLLIDSRREEVVSNQMLQAYSARKLGFYWFLKPSMTDTIISHNSDPTSARTLMGGEFTWGFLPSVFGIFLFLLCGTVSRHIHKTAKFREL